MSDPLPATLARDLTRDEIHGAVARLLDPAASDAERAAFLVALSDKGETGAELAAFAEALLPHAVPIPAPPVAGPLLDCCGTGGGGLSIFNVSTAAMFVLAAGGVPVVKHGNRGVTKPSGSADVMQALGLRVELRPDEVGQSLADLGFAFLYAPAFHPAFKVLAPVRKALGAQGRRTVFNLLGPLLNPLRPGARLVGVFKDSHVRLFRDALISIQCSRFAVVCGIIADDVMGEVGHWTTVAVSEGLPLRQGTHHSDIIGRFVSQPLATLTVCDAAMSARMIEKYLDPKSDLDLGSALLIANAGWGFWLQGLASSLDDGVRMAEHHLANGAALAKLQQARQWAQDHSGA